MWYIQDTIEDSRRGRPSDLRTIERTCNALNERLGAKRYQPYYAPAGSVVLLLDTLVHGM